MLRRVPLTVLGRTRAPFNSNNSNNLLQWQNQMVTGGDGAPSPLLQAEYMAAEAYALSHQQALPPSADVADAAEAQGGAGEAEERQRTPPPEGSQARVLVNGIYSLTCPLPEDGSSRSDTVAADQRLNVMGDSGGITLDVFFQVRAPGGDQLGTFKWSGHLVVEHTDGTEELVDLGEVDDSTRATHTASHISSSSIQSLCVEVRCVEAAVAAAPTIYERRLVSDVVSILQDTRLNPHGGSVASVIVGNKAKEAPLYEYIVERNYGGSWLEFVRAHRDQLALFKYSEREVRTRKLAPMAKSTEPRIALGPMDRNEVLDADEVQAEKARRQERVLCDFITGLLKDGELCNSVVLQRLRHSEEFCNSLAPNPSHLMRFLSRHDQLFSWTAAPDLVTRIGLADPGRYPHRSRHSDFHRSSASQQVSRRKQSATCPARQPSSDVLAPAEYKPVSRHQARCQSFASDGLTHSDMTERADSMEEPCGLSASGTFEAAEPIGTYRHDPYNPQSSWCGIEGEMSYAA